MSEVESKSCKKCNIEKPISEFWMTDKKYGYLRNSCKDCDRETARRYYANNEEHRERVRTSAKRNAKPATPEKSRSYSLKYKYGLTKEQYEAMVIDQGGKCALCGADDPGRTKLTGKWKAGHWNIDHCHKDGHVRGLLCHTCNVRVGAYERLMDDVGEEKLKQYLNI